MNTIVVYFVLLPTVVGIHVISKPSETHDKRYFGAADMLLLMQSNQDCSATLAMAHNSTSNFSVHYVICQNGSIYLLVNESERAWSLGASYWHGRTELDHWSISIQLEIGTSSAMNQSLAALIKDIRSRRQIFDFNIVSRPEISCFKTMESTVFCPEHNQTQIPWKFLAENGIGIQLSAKPTELTPNISQANIYLKEIGYYTLYQDITSTNTYFNRSLLNFVRRYLPEKQAILTPTVYSALKAVANSYRTQFLPYWKCFSKITASPPRQPITVNTSFPSINQDARLLGPPFMLVIHDTECDLQRALDILTGKTGGVSIHYIVDRKGNIYRLVDESQRAWHAGRSYWKGFRDLNDASIGIELINEESAKYGYPDVQITALISLIEDIRSRYWIPQELILSHEDIAPTRRDDPGVFFQWNRLWNAGIGLNMSSTGPAPPAPPSYLPAYYQQMRRMLKDIGFYSNENDQSASATTMKANVKHFQWRFFPQYPNYTLDKVDVPLWNAIGNVRNVYRSQYENSLYRRCDPIPTNKENRPQADASLLAVIIINVAIFYYC